MTFHKFPNIFLILVRGGILYVKWTMRQTTFAKGHERNRCSTISSESQKQHLLHPFHRLSIKLYLVGRIFSLMNRAVIFLLPAPATFSYQGCLARHGGSSFPSLIAMFPRLVALQHLLDQRKWAGPLAVLCKFLFRGPARICFFSVSVLFFY
jgi:hypothetical protein